MSCRDDYEVNNEIVELSDKADEVKVRTMSNDRLFFGVESRIQSDDILQNNLTMFDWATKNKLYPNFWGRNINGEDCLTKEEILFIHKIISKCH